MVASDYGSTDLKDLEAWPIKPDKKEKRLDARARVSVTSPPF